MDRFTKLFTSCHPAVQFGIVTGVAVLVLVLLSNHGVVGNLLDLFKAFPLVVCISIRMGTGKPAEREAVTPAPQQGASPSS